MEPGSAARKGFWIAVIIASLGLSVAFFNPFMGVLQAGIFFAVAWGIRRGRSWAAVAGLYFVTIPLVLATLRLGQGGGRGLGEWAGILLSDAVVLLCAYFLLRAAGELRRPRAGAAAASRFQAWPWAALIAAGGLYWLCLEPYVIPTEAMEDTLLAGDNVFVETLSTRLGRLPQRDELVVLRYPVDRRQTFVKRIAGISGDRLRIQNKQLYRNGILLAEPYARHRSNVVDSYRDNFPGQPNLRIFPGAEEMLRDHVKDGEVVVPAGRYFVLGDNRDNSLDSRYWGFVASQDVIGRPVLIYASYDLSGPSRGAPKLPTIFTTRWNRLFKRV